MHLLNTRYLDKATRIKGLFQSGVEGYVRRPQEGEWQCGGPRNSTVYGHLNTSRVYLDISRV